MSRPSLQSWIPIVVAAALAAVPSASPRACVTCENMQCRAIPQSGAIDCSSGWFFGSYCNLSGDCRGSDVRTPLSPKKLAPLATDPPISLAADAATKLDRHDQGPFGARSERFTAVPPPAPHSSPRSS